MQSHGFLPFEYQIENSKSGLTSFSGLPLYMDFAMVTGLCKNIAEKLRVKVRGWEDHQIIMSLIMLNLIGGTCVEDIDRLESDAGMHTLLLKIETHGMKRRQRRAYELRFRKSKERAFPSPSALRRYLEKFDNAEQNQLRVEGKAFIPACNEILNNLVDLNSVLVEFAQSKKPTKTATLDQDATLCPTSKHTALYCYKKFKAYQPFNTYWDEQGILLHSEFRDGNVNAGYDQLRILKSSLDILPDGIEKVCLRSDSAGYQQDLLRYCAEGQNDRFGVIDFAIATKVTSAFKIAVQEVVEKSWQPIYKEDENGSKIKTEQEWADVCFVPNFIAISNSAPVYRYIAIREKMNAQPELEGIETKQGELPFQTLNINKVNYKLFGVVTNRKIPGNDLINWHRRRCGNSEKVHCTEKTDLAGGQFPSNKFGANAAWWAVMIMTFNLNALMKQLVMPKELNKKRLKGLRLYVINVAGRLVQHARTLSIKLSGGVKTLELFQLIKKRITALATPPPVLSTA